MQDDPPSKRRRLSKCKVDPKNWIKPRNKQLRLRGKEYLGVKKSTITKTWEFTETKCERKLKGGCECAWSLKGKLYKCREFSNDKRQNIFDNFWNLDSWEARKFFIRNLVTAIPTNNGMPTTNEKKKKLTFIFKLFLDGNTVRVCKKKFLNTLDIGE